MVPASSKSASFKARMSTPNLRNIWQKFQLLLLLNKLKFSLATSPPCRFCAQVMGSTGLRRASSPAMRGGPSPSGSFRGHISCRPLRTVFLQDVANILLNFVDCRKSKAIAASMCILQSSPESMKLSSEKKKPLCAAFNSSTEALIQYAPTSLPPCSSMIPQVLVRHGP